MVNTAEKVSDCGVACDEHKLNTKGRAARENGRSCRAASRRYASSLSCPRLTVACCVM